MRFSATLFITASIALFTVATNTSGQPYDCGDAPIEPLIEDGSTASLEQLVATSTRVNTFIEDADTFLDCQEALYKKGLQPRPTKEKISEIVRDVTARRNDIGEEFNEQVAAYKTANP